MVSLGRAEVIQKGPWAGKNLVPVGHSDVAVVEGPIAAGIVCRHAKENYDKVAQLDRAAQTSASLGIPVFAVVQVENEDQVDVVEEVTTQRGIRMPVFTSTDDFLGDKECIFVLLSDGQTEEIPEGSAAKLLGAAAAKSSKIGTAAPEVQTTSVAMLPAKNPLYVNQRYEFSVRWPKGWNYRVARSNDGAVGVPPPGSQLEARVWGAPEIKSNDPTDPPPYVQIKDYLNLLKAQAVGDVKVETKLKVFDGDIEGRDYTYSYTRAGKDGQPGSKYRGRIQAFVVDGVAKLICVEGPEEEFNREKDTIENFFYSFHPYLD